MGRWVLALLLVATLGCVGGVTKHGVFGSFGQSDISTCGSGETDCTDLKGEAISVPGAQLVGGWLALVTTAAAKFFGIELPAPEKEVPSPDI